MKTFNLTKNYYFSIFLYFPSFICFILAIIHFFMSIKYESFSCKVNQLDNFDFDYDSLCMNRVYTPLDRNLNLIQDKNTIFIANSLIANQRFYHSYYHSVELFLIILSFTFLIPKLLWFLIKILTKYNIYLYRINLRLKYLKESDFKLQKLYYGYYSCVYAGFILLIIQLTYTDKLLDNRFINFGFEKLQSLLFLNESKSLFLNYAFCELILDYGKRIEYDSIVYKRLQDDNGIMCYLKLNRLNEILFSSLFLLYLLLIIFYIIYFIDLIWLYLSIKKRLNRLDLIKIHVENRKLQEEICKSFSRWFICNQLCKSGSLEDINNLIVYISRLDNYKDFFNEQEEKFFSVEDVTRR